MSTLNPHTGVSSEGVRRWEELMWAGVESGLLPATSTSALVTHPTLQTLSWMLSPGTL